MSTRFCIGMAQGHTPRLYLHLYNNNVRSKLADVFKADAAFRLMEQIWKPSAFI